jgi:hypothetical protein
MLEKNKIIQFLINMFIRNWWAQRWEKEEQNGGFKATVSKVIFLIIQFFQKHFPSNKLVDCNEKEGKLDYLKKT